MKKPFMCIFIILMSMLSTATSAYSQHAQRDRNCFHLHSIDEQCPQHTATDFRINQKASEIDLSKVINEYCMARRWSGYIRVLQFHNWLMRNSSWTKNIELIKRMPEAQNNNGQTVPNFYAEIASYLELNSDPMAKYDYVALICYATQSGPHSVFLGYDHDYFIRDVNFFDRFVDNCSSFDFCYGPQAKVLEYAILRIKRQPSAAKEWRHYTPSRFSATKKASDNYNVLDQPIPIKHLRVTNSDKGIDGTPYYTGIKIRSFSDPDFEIIYANYYNMPTLSINGKYEAIGHRTSKETFEFDLGQIADDLYIWGYQYNFNFANLSYQ